jgi:hypothetical protein
MDDVRARLARASNYGEEMEAFLRQSSSPRRIAIASRPRLGVASFAGSGHRTSSHLKSIDVQRLSIVIGNLRREGLRPLSPGALGNAGSLTPLLASHGTARGPVTAWSCSPSSFLRELVPAATRVAVP